MEPRDDEIFEKFSDTRLSKTEIRERFERLRVARSASELAGLSSAISSEIVNSDIFRSAQTVALYSAVRGEVDVSPVLPVLRESGKKVFFPRVCGRDLRFFEVSDAGELSAGSFSIPEPPEDPAREAAPSDIDLIVVPGLCFDRSGSRIGYGKGFYDRTTRGLNTEKVCAAAYSFQFVDFEIPSEPHDARVGFVITERGVFRARKEGLKNV
ncbi:MAG: 5-formyltetrahydrofolate cyclo-ligase [Candidatus Mycalebacterium zealandia]|nr:MAG: 5-formyltetrahydrofolate cyclo-ligase [Candidatus Mycalebacterium zealandia]